MSSAQTTALEYALLAAGQTTEITTAPTAGADPADWPPFGSGGVDVSTVSRVHILAMLGEDGLHRTARISFDVVDLATTYQLQIGGGNVTYNAGSGAPANTAALIVQWAAALNGNPTMAAVITASVDPDDSEVLLIRWDYLPSLLALTVGGATAEVVVTTEYEEGVAVLFGRGVSRVVLATSQDSDAARTRADGWALMQRPDGSPCQWTIENSGCLRVTDVPVAGVQAVAVVMYGLTHLVDTATGGASATIEYASPWVAIAPCPVS
jgi:hypothetical protein